MPLNVPQPTSLLAIWPANVSGALFPGEYLFGRSFNKVQHEPCVHVCGIDKETFAGKLRWLLLKVFGSCVWLQAAVCLSGCLTFCL